LRRTLGTEGPKTELASWACRERHSVTPAALGPYRRPSPMVRGRNSRQVLCAMLNYLSEEIRNCRRKAEDCARKAAAQIDPKLKKHLLHLEEHWLSVARSYAYHEQRSDLSDETKGIDATANTGNG
jgi:hypothetical protein